MVHTLEASSLAHFFRFRSNDGQSKWMKCLSSSVAFWRLIRRFRLRSITCFALCSKPSLCISWYGSSGPFWGSHKVRTQDSVLCTLVRLSIAAHLPCILVARKWYIWAIWLWGGWQLWAVWQFHRCHCCWPCWGAGRLCRRWQLSS